MNLEQLAEFEIGSQHIQCVERLADTLLLGTYDNWIIGVNAITYQVKQSIKTQFTPFSICLKDRKTFVVGERFGTVEVFEMEENWFKRIKVQSFGSSIHKVLSVGNCFAFAMSDFQGV